MKQEIEQIIKNNLPKKLEADMCENPCDSCLKGDGYNQAINEIPVSLIADEVLKVVKLEIEKKYPNYKENYHDEVEEIINLLSEHLSPNKENKNNE